MHELEQKYRNLGLLFPNRSEKFGRLYLYESIESGEKFLLKIIAKTERNRKNVAQVMQESTFHFQHPNLPYIVSVENTDHSFSLLKKYQPGLTLDVFWNSIPQRRRWDFLKRFIAAFCSVYEELEKNRIVHGDLKPQNILIDGDIENFSCSLIDFGLAVSIDNLPKRSTLFQLAYSSPEMILNRLDLLNTGTDLYSLGLILYRLWTGEPAFYHKNPAIYTNLSITYPLSDRKNIPKEMWTIIQKMTFKHTFKKSPSSLSTEELTDRLKENQKRRFEKIEEFAREFDTIQPSKWSNSSINPFGNRYSN